MHILYLTPYVPSPNKSRAYGQIYGLHRAGHRVTVATVYRNATDLQQIQALRDDGIEVLSAKLSRGRLLMNALRVLPTRQPLQARIVWSPELLRKIETYCDEEQPDIIHAEHLRTAVYGLYLKDRIPFLWDPADYLAALYEQTARQSSSFLWRWIARFEAPRLAAYERWLTSQFPVTLAISNRDKRGFDRDNPCAERVHVVLLAVPARPLAPKEREPKTLIFTGTMSYHPNVSSVLFFVQEVFPFIQAAEPDVKLQIVGANPIAAIQELRSQAIEVTGRVDSVMDHLQRATIAVAPVTYASGMQTKVLEAFLTGTPLVAMSKAVENLAVRDGEHLLIADTARAFADAVLRLLNAPDERTQIGNAGYQYVIQHHDIQQIVHELTNHYNDVINASRKPQ